MAQAKSMRDVATSARRTGDVRRTEAGGTFTPAPVNLEHTNIQAEKKLSSFEKDLQALNIGTKQAVTEVYQASEWADKVRTNDTYTNYIMGMQNIDKFYSDKMDKGQALTVQDYKDKKDWQNKFYQSMIDQAVAEGDDTNLIFKNGFIDPATEHLMKTNAHDTQAQFVVHRRNTIDNVNEVIDKIGTNMTPDMAELQIQRLKAVGVGHARETVWGEVATSMNNEFYKKFKDGLDSPTLQGYLENGVLTQDGIDRLYNDTYGRFSKRTNGQFTSQVGDITDEAHLSMMKSFKGWIDGYQSKLRARTSYGEETISDTISKVDVMNTSVKDMAETAETLAAQYQDVAPHLNPSKLASVQDKMRVFAEKQMEAATLDTIYQQLNVGKDGLVSNYDEVISQDWKIDQRERTIAEGITVTTTAKKIPKERIQAYVDNRLYREAQATLLRGDANQASLLGKKIAQLQDSGFKGTSIVGLMKDNIVHLTNTGGKTAKSVNELVNEIYSAGTFAKSSGMPNASFLGNKAINGVTSFVADLRERAKTDDRLTEDVILARTKMYVYGLARDFENLKGGKGTATLLKNISGGDPTQQDEVVSGYVFGGVIGETKFADGVLDTVVTLAASEDVAIDNIEKLQDYTKSKAMIIDRSYLPIWGDSISFINPTKSNDRRGQKNVRENMQTLVNDALKNANMKTEVDISDLTDEEDVRLYQYPDVNGDIMTVVNVYSSGKLLLPIMMSPEDLTTGVWSWKNKSGVK